MSNLPKNDLNGLVSIVIPCWNGEKWVEKCLSSIKEQSYKNFELIVIDNGSTDRSVGIMMDSFRDLKPMIIGNPSNYGFAKAMNQGIDASQGEFIFALNLDVILKPDYIDKLIKALDDPQIGSATGKMYRLPELFGGKQIIDTTGHVFLAERSVLNRGMLEEDLGQFDDKKEIFGVCAAAALYRRTMLDDVKIGKEYFDEDYFAYYEDVDLDWRAINAGWKSVFVPEAVGFHAKRAFAKKRDKEMMINSNRNKYLTIVKNDSLMNFIIDLPVIAAHDLDYLFYSHFRDYRLFFKSLIKKILLTPLALRKRSKLKDKKIISAREFRKYIVYDRKDRIKARDLVVSVIGIVLLSFFIKFRYLLVLFFAVFFIFNPVVYHVHRLLEKQKINS